MQLELRYLAHVTGKREYWDPAEKVNDLVATATASQGKQGLNKIFINADTGKFSGSTITLGARGDSYYEYLLKQYLQTSQTEGKYWHRWKGAISGVFQHLLKHTTGKKRLTFVGELLSAKFSPKMDHLVCFLPGALALSAKHAPVEDRQDPTVKRHMQVAKELMETCMEMYR